jgi:hypothetical protein
VPTLACGTGADGLTELVVSFDGKPAIRLSGPELDVQPPSRRQPKRSAGAADERMRTRTQNKIGGTQTPPADLERQMLTEDYQKRLNLIFTPAPVDALVIYDRRNASSSRARAALRPSLW